MDRWEKPPLAWPSVYAAWVKADIARGMADPTQDPIYQAQLGVIAQQARDMTERDKQLAQQQAIQAGQFGLGSTALGETGDLAATEAGRASTTSNGHCARAGRSS